MCQTLKDSMLIKSATFLSFKGMLEIHNPSTLYINDSTKCSDNGWTDIHSLPSHKMQ